MCEYTDRKRAFVVFGFGTTVFSDSAAARSDDDYERTLKSVAIMHPDFRVVPMQDGNALVRFNGPVTGVVLADFYRANEATIRNGVVSGGMLENEVVVVAEKSDAEQRDFIAGLYARAKLYRDVEDCRIAQRFEPAS
jgi:hypothetical protein